MSTGMTWDRRWIYTIDSSLNIMFQVPFLPGYEALQVGTWYLWSTGLRGERRNVTNGMDLFRRCLQRGYFVGSNPVSRRGRICEIYPIRQPHHAHNVILSLQYR